MVLFIRTEEERDALQGQFPASLAGVREVSLPAQASVTWQGSQASMASLFAQLKEEGGM